jgi:excisionase family DNA binding protein
MTVSEAAGFLEVSKPTIYRWINDERIPYIRHGRYIRFVQSDLEQWIEARRVKAAFDADGNPI